VSADTLDVEGLRAWLTRAAPGWALPEATVSVHRYPAGFSNLTYRVSVSDTHGTRTLVLRRPPPGVEVGVAHDMAREFAILSALHPLGVAVPEPIACCTDLAVLGVPFYVMAHVDGVILRGTIPGGDEDRTPARLAALSQTCVETLASIHAVPVAGTPLAALGKGDGYVRRQVAGWTRRWEASRTRDVPTLDRTAAWLAAHAPADSGVTLVHNDFKLDNLVLDPSLSHVRAVLDWEMATVGDPLLDLGTTLAYWVQADDAPVFRALGLGVTALPGAYTRDAFVAAYEAARGARVPHRRFVETFGVFKVAVIAQQIAARFERGVAQDARFAALPAVVAALGERAAALMAS